MSDKLCLLNLLEPSMTMFLKNNLLLENTREWWVRPINVKRERCGEFHLLFNDLRGEEQRFKSYFQMLPQTFYTILDLITEDLQKQETNYRKPVSPEERLALTLRFLATGMSFRSLAHSYRLGTATVSRIIAETLTSIWTRLNPIYLKKPTKESLKSTAKGFLERCNFPNVIGAIDGKHVCIQAPPKSGSNFFNYKHFFSIVLQGVADSDLKFIMVEVGAYGKESDGGVFSRSKTRSFYEKNEMDMGSLPDLSADLPYFLLGDAAYPFRQYLLTPFSGNLTTQMQIYSYRNSRARRCIECAFGLLAAKWRVLKSVIATDIKTSENIILAAVILRNAILTLEGNTISASDIDIEEWNNGGEGNPDCTEENVNVNRGLPEQYAIWMRQKLVDYFVGAGALPWQNAVPYCKMLRATKYNLINLIATDSI